RILLIPTRPDHAWGTHMYEFECKLLAKCLNQTPGVEAVVSPDFDWPRSPKLLEGVKALVYYSRPAADIILDPLRRKQTHALLKSGVGFTAIHWATGTGSVKLGPEYLDILGGWFHSAHSKLRVDKKLLEQADPKHPVCRGWKPFDLREEFYLDLKFHPKARPVLKVTVQDKQQVVAWAFERPDANGGRSFGTTLGHFHDNFTVEAFRRLLVNGILWTAH